MLLTSSLAFALVQTPLAPPTLAPSPAFLFGANFGYAMDINGDNALVSAPFGINGTAGFGAVYAYRWNGQGWDFAQELDIPQSVPPNEPLIIVGADVSISGNTALVGVPGSDAGGNNSGTVLVYEDQAAGWVLVDELVPPAGSDTQAYGYGVSLDGDLALVSPLMGPAPFLVYERSAGGAWSLVQAIASTDPVPEPLDSLGQAQVHGDTLFLPLQDVGPFETGEIQVWTRGAGGWNFSERVGPGAAHQMFGRSFDVDGDTMAVLSASGGGIFSPGQFTYIYERQGSTWQLAQQFLVPTEGAFSEYTASIALCGDRLILPAYDGFPAVTSTSALVYERINGAFTLVEQIPAPAAAGVEAFGVSMAMDGDRAILGSNTCDAAFSYSGEAWSFDVGRLAVDTRSISLSSGGAQQLALRAGLPFANLLYALVGSASGTTPGVVLDGVLLPLNPDGYSVKSLDPGSSPIAAPIGTLDALGQAATQVALPPNTNPSLAGLPVAHAFVVIDPASIAIVAASEPEGLELLP